MMKVEIRQGNIDDATLIQEFGIRTFKETFEKFNSKENMALYIDKCFTLEQIINDMKTPGTNFFLAIADNQITGYTKTNEGPGPKELNQKKTLEIERIYVDSKFHGEGIGKSLLDKCIQLARLKNIKPYGSVYGNTILMQLHSIKNMDLKNLATTSFCWGVILKQIG